VLSARDFFDCIAPAESNDTASPLTSVSITVISTPSS
jgi:hypothetical protein